MSERARAPRIMFSVAEISGDLYAADLARHLRRVQPSLTLFGAGGPRMAAAGVDVRLDVTQTSTFGVGDLIAALPGHLRSGLLIRRMLIRERPDALLLVDAPGFNFPLARIARRLRIPTIYYIAPQTWIWNPEPAARRLRDAVGVVIAIFEREAALYRRVGAPVAYFGHPLADLAAAPRASTREVRQRLVVDDATTIGVFPGSRRSEIARLLPTMLQGVRLAERHLGRLQIVIGVAAEGLRPFIDQALDGHGDRVHVVTDARDALVASDVALAASGTILLEAIALDTPAIMTYRVDWLTHYYAKFVLRVERNVPFYALANLVAGEYVIPELVEEHATAGNMADALISVLTDPGSRDGMRRGYARIRASLGPPGVVQRVAAHVVQVLSH